MVNICLFHILLSDFADGNQPSSRLFSTDTLTERILLNDIELRKIDLEDRNKIQDLLVNVRKEESMDETAREYYKEIDDFISTRKARNPLESMVYNISWENRGLLSWFINQKKPDGSTFDIHIRGDRLQRAFNTLILMPVLLLLLVPIGILYFAEPNKGTSAAVIVVSGFFALVTVAKVSGIKFDAIFVCMSAYMAVLVTFLANLHGRS